MKNIKDYITKYSPIDISKNEYYYEHLTDFYGDDVPEKYLNLYNECKLSSFEYIDENLQTHDYKKLQDKLMKEFKSSIKEFHDYSEGKKIKSFYIVLNNNSKLSIHDIQTHTGDAEKLFDLLDFFNYKLSNYNLIDDNYCLFIEPIFSEDASEYFNKCHRQAYHFTLKENVESILKNGLRMKSGKYRAFPSRIFLWASDKKLDKQKNKVNEFIKNIFGDLYDLSNVGIIKVDLFHTDYPIYRDTAMEEKEALFVYNNIPAKLCKEVKL